MNTVLAERYGSAFVRFITTKGFLVWLLLGSILSGAVLFAFLINDPFSVRFVKYFKIAFGMAESTANIISMTVVGFVSFLAYMIIMARSMITTIAKITVIDKKTGKPTEVYKEVGKYDHYLLGGSIILIEILVIINMIYESWKGSSLNDSFTMDMVIILAAAQLVFGLMLKTSTNMAKYANDAASKNIDKEAEIAHNLANEEALSALKPEQSASKPLLGKMPNTNFEIRKSKIA